MSFQRILKHIPSGAWLAGGVASFFATLYPHTLGLEEYIERKHYGKPDQIDAEILVLAEEIKAHLKWQPSTFYNGNLLTFFPSREFDFSHQGSIHTKWGAAVGVPVIFSKDALKGAKDDPAYLVKFGIDLQSERGQQIYDTLHLSEAAKKFALAREICHANSLQVYANSICVSLAVSGAYVLSTFLSQLLHFPGGKMFSFFIVIPSMALGCLKMIDSYNCKVEANADKSAASISGEVACGGVEYYTALATREALVDRPELDKKDNLFLSRFNPGWRKAELTPVERKDLLIEAVKQVHPELCK